MIKVEHANAVLDTAKILNVSASTIRREIKTGTIPHFKIGGRVMIPGWFLADLLKRPDSDAAA